jgi:hypothetical protein
LRKLFHIARVWSITSCPESYEFSGAKTVMSITKNTRRVFAREFCAQVSKNLSTIRGVLGVVKANDFGQISRLL